jgi:glycosyltransferase involved in cell wall biosynthesis
MAVQVSVVIPAYNRARYVAQAVQSALDQAADNLAVEVIVVDDGSTDDTRDVVMGLGERVCYVWQRNQREGVARNRGVVEAHGEYLAYLDSDDYWLPGKLAADVRRLEALDAPALVYSRAENVDQDGRSLGVRQLAVHEGDVFWDLARESFTPMSSVAARTDAFRACGGFVEDPDLSGTADWELWLRLAARWPVGFAGDARTCIRVHPRNMLGDPDWMERAMLAGVRHALADPVVAERVRGREGELWSHMYVTIALNAYGNGLPRRGGRWLARALRAWPRQALDRRFWGCAVRLLARPRARRLPPVPGTRVGMSA